MNIVHKKETEKEVFPNFLCVGAQKSATTTFSDMLRQHPDVFVSSPKELHYFQKRNYQYNNKNLYSNYFRGSESYKIRAEFTPDYLYIEECPSRILELLGSETKILILLRNPTDRAFSQYLMLCSEGEESNSFEEAFHLETQSTIQSNSNLQRFHYFQRGLYSKQVARYLTLFSNVKIVLFEDFIGNTDKEMEDIYQFLEIKSLHIPLVKSNEQRILRSQFLNYCKKYMRQKLSRVRLLRKSTLLLKAYKSIEKANTLPNKTRSEIDPAFAKVLQDYYHDDICELETLIGRDLTTWKTKY